MVKIKQLGVKRKIQKKALKKIKQVFPITAVPTQSKGKKLTNI